MVAHRRWLTLQLCLLTAAQLPARVRGANYLHQGPRQGGMSYLPNLACRTCRGHRPTNAIWVQRGAIGQAGLADRCALLYTILQMAQSVCARVFAPRPCVALADGHNGGKSLPCNVSWSHFIDFRITHSGQSPLLERPPSLLSADGDGATDLLVVNGTFDRGHWANSSHVISEYDEAVSAVDSGRRFVWLLGTPFWTWHADLAKHIARSSRSRNYPAKAWLPPQLVPNVLNVSPTRSSDLVSTGTKASAKKLHLLESHRCDHVNLSASPVVKRMAAEVEREIGAPLSEVTAIHVRRGDSLGFVTCNTTAEHLGDLVQEAVRLLAGAGGASPSVLARGTRHGGAGDTNRVRVRALIFTDERETPYLETLLERVASAYGGEGAALLGDPIVNRVLAASEPVLGAPLASSNYMTYAVGNAIFMAAASAMKFGWGSPSCLREECGRNRGEIMKGRPGEEDACTSGLALSFPAER